MNIRRVTGLSLSLVAAAGVVASLAAQSIDSDVAALLDYSELESVLATLPDGIRATLGQLSSDPLPEAVSAALDRQFSVTSLRRIMETQFTAQGDDSMIVAAAQLVQTGAIKSVQDLIRQGEPDSSLEEYAASLNTSPPPQERIQLVAQIASVQLAGDFYVVLNERTLQAAHTIAAVAWPGAPPYEPPTDEALVARAQQNLMGAVVTFLWQYQAIDDALLQRALEEWSSDPGAWYSRAYTLALADTITLAAEAVAADVAPRSNPS